jgi:hypothetical protein
MVRLYIALSLGLFLIAPLWGQASESELRLFGYFQSSFTHQSENEVGGGNGESLPDQNTFSVQQLNLFMQKDLARNWTTLVNFEVLNSYSSSRRWGSYSLEEAWTRYRFSKRLNVKVGLHIPPFNNLNEIKNRTPLLPYIIRPLVYETSYSEFIAVEEFTPARAYGQVYGVLPLGRSKVDYALYLGNSPNISSQFDSERLGESLQTGVDTTSRIMVGGRVGLRHGEMRAGVSATYDNLNFDANTFNADFSLNDSLASLGIDSFDPDLVPRLRLGTDFSLHFRSFSFESEIIQVRYGDDVNAFDFNKTFFYATLGCFVTEELFAYVSYWDTRQHFLPFADTDIKVPNFGVAYNLHDAVYLKGHYAYVKVEEEEVGNSKADHTFHFVGAAVSVFF